MACVCGFSLTQVCGEPPEGCYISTGDNHWLASSLPIDSPASIEASFEFLHKLGIRRVYWRGLQEAAWLETLVVREENCRYAGFWRWAGSLYARFSAAQALGMVRRSPQAAEALIGATRHEDPVVADRAATSLGSILERSEKEIAPLRDRIAVALRDLYVQLGDGCRRVDAEWGYRPVGNALLKLGAPGEDILREFMAQTRDRRLAEQAWRSLCIRQDNGRFSEVTEAENEEAYRQRPAWLDAAESKSPP